MKKSIIIISLLISAIFISSCREISVVTIVNNDGSFTRVITITGDSSDVYKSGLPYPIDYTWEKKFVADSVENDKFILTYTKTFDNSNVLANEINSDTSWRKQLKRNITVDKSFGFFYTYLTYEETFGAANPFSILDYHDFMSEKDLQWLKGEKLALNSNDSVNIENAENKAEQFLQKSFTTEIIKLLKEGIIKLENSTLVPDMVDGYYDSISDKVHRWDINSTTEYVDYFAELTNKKDILRIKDLEYDELKSLDGKIELLFNIFEMEDYSVSVNMPGLITYTNSLSIHGNQTNWNINTMSFLFEEYKMISESRIVNYNMFIISGIVLLLLISLTAIKLWK